MSLQKKQSEFAHKVALLILFANAKGYEVTFGDAYSKAEYGVHKPDSYHFIRLAIDLNLIKDGVYLTETDDHRPLGMFWESLGGTWGGRFGDGNHYSWGE